MERLYLVMNRVWQLLVVLFAIVSLVFLLQRLIPGSPADVILGPDTPEAVKDEWLQAYGFHKPLWEQYTSYLHGILNLDFGRTFFSNQPVFSVIWQRVPNTLMLTFTAFSLSVALSFTLGLLAAGFHGTWLDKTISFFSVLAISAPAFVVGPWLMWVFSVKLGWLPLLGSHDRWSWVLPSCSMGFAFSAFTTRLLRSGVVDVLKEDFIRTAYSKGLKPWAVVVRHALPNALLPTVTVLGLQLGVLLSGAVITETIFAWPGLGSLTIEAVQNREYNLVSACVVVMAVVYVFSNALVDVLHQAIDPRLRT